VGFELFVQVAQFAIGCFELLVQNLGLFLLPFYLGDVGDRFQDVYTPIRGFCFGPLDKEIFVIWQGHFTRGDPSTLEGFWHLAEFAWSCAGSNFVMAFLIGDITELLKRDLILKDDLVGDGVDHCHDDWLAIQQYLGVVLMVSVCHVPNSSSRRIRLMFQG
jgi:hypothetical protein